MAALFRIVAALLAAWALHGPAHAADAQRGHALYTGQIMLRARAADGAPLPAAAAACVACHRRSGLGSFEGGVAAPPISGQFLFAPMSATTGNIFPWPSALRTRPAYDAPSLHGLLTTGKAPDGVAMRAPMPRYALSAQDAEDLAAYLHTLSKPVAPGVSDSTIELATILTPGIAAQDRAAVIEVMHAYVTQKNALSRQETGRARMAQRGQLTMYRNYRQWHVNVWELSGPADGWGEQLQALYRERPVFAVVGGMGHGDWTAVAQFCESESLPCLFPITRQPPDRLGYYSLYFDGGWAADAAIAAEALKARRVQRFVLQATSAQASAAARVRQAMLEQGLSEAPADSDEADTARVLLGDASGTPPSSQGWTVHLGTTGVPQRTGPRELWVSAQLQGEALQRQLLRPTAWLKKQGLSYLPASVATSTLYAASVAGEALMHIDLGFSREYCIEKLEHGLENMVPLSPYPRLSLGPDQRIASKGSFLGVAGQDGRIVWEWRRP